jgi:hypothetical protein
VKDVTPRLKESQRPWVCQKENPDCTRTKPCRSCLGRRSRRGGLAKQRTARKQLAVPDSRFHGQNGNEENWRGPFRVEVKSGLQVKALASRFLDAEAQSWENKAVGDVRPFLFVAMPQQWGSEGLVAIRLSTWQTCVAPYLP